jgi:restriction system protein
MWLSLDSKTYRRFHDIIIPGTNGTTQIDHLLVSRYGVFIIETKNKKGWIFGAEDQPKWTQSIYGKKYSFQNPLRQTFRQRKVLCEFLNMNHSLVHSIILFVGDCVFKTTLPANVMRSGLGQYVKNFRDPVLSTEKVSELIQKLEMHSATSTLTTRNHIQSLKTRHSSSTACPNCGADLIERQAKKGRNSGSSFLGCKNYPRCRFTKSA